MKPTTLSEVEKFLTEHPKDSFKVGLNVWFANTNNWQGEEVAEAGSDIKFVFGDVELRRFESSQGRDFQSTDFLRTPEQAMGVAQAFLALSVVIPEIQE